jgi:hypothetical protein
MDVHCVCHDAGVLGVFRAPRRKAVSSHCASQHVGADLTAAYSQTPHLHLLRLSVRYSRSGVNVPPSVARNPLSRDAITSKPRQTSPSCTKHLSLTETGSSYVLPRILTPKQEKYNGCDLAVHCFVHSVGRCLGFTSLPDHDSPCFP